MKGQRRSLGEAAMSRRGSVQLGLVLPVLIALACTLGVNRMRHWADERRTGEVILSHIDSNSNRQNVQVSRVTSLGIVVEDQEDFSMRADTEGFASEIEELGRSSRSEFDELHGGDAEIDAVRSAFESFQNRLTMVIDLLEDGHLTQAWIYNRERVDVSYRNLHERLRSLERTFEDEAQSAGLVADVATLVLVLTSGVLIVLLRRRVDRQRQAFQEQLEHQAFHDPLTDLPNRTMLEERLAQALARTRRTGSPIALLFIDLDNFKSINDSLGHHGGDAFLVSIAERLKECTRTSDTIARLGGDEFAILLEDISAPGDAEEIAQRVIDRLSEPGEIHGRKFASSCSIGLSVSMDGRESVEEVLGNADVAMYAAKQSGRDRYESFSPGMRLSQIDHAARRADLQRAIELEEFVLHYQPIIDLEADVVVGVEALVRWQHPSRGLVVPADFIPLAEETGQILPIGRWVLEGSCAQVFAWQQMMPGRSLSLSVNLSGVQFRQRDLVDEVATALAGSGLDASSLVLEITESTLMADDCDTMGKLEELKELGVRFAIDDFGVGYSSLSYLRRFPVDHLKIDRSFVQSIDGGPEDRALCEAIVKLGATLGLVTVAEGIENDEQLRWFQGKHCPYGQGYLFQRPATASEITALLVPGAALHSMAPART